MLPKRRQREDEDVDIRVVRRRRFMDDGTRDPHSVDPIQLQKLKENFFRSDANKLIQNMLCANSLHDVCVNREFMQSRNNHFSHVLDPKLTVSNQGLSGRCWGFAVYNVMRHEIIRKLQLPLDFEFSESYLSFYEKIEKCNKILTYFLDKDEITIDDLNVRGKLIGCVEDGGFWVTCANLIKKYGIIPKVCFKESNHSYSTDELNNILGYKIKEFVLKMVEENNKDKRVVMKTEMMEQVYSILVKMIGCPPGVDEKIEWSFSLREDLQEKLERENRRRRNNRFETLKIKKSLHISPREFYQLLIVHDLNDYYRFSHDPRNEYNKYYESYDEEIVIGGERNGYYNISMDEIIKMCATSIKNNTPVQFDCDVEKYINNDEELLDTRCYDYESIFGMSFTDLSKKERMKVMDSYANHAMILVGINEEHECHEECGSKTSSLGICDCNGKKTITKFKIENSWGRKPLDIILEEDSGYYIAGLDWFKNYVYTIVVHKDYVPKKLRQRYQREKQRAIVLPENDIMA